MGEAVSGSFSVFSSRPTCCPLAAALAAFFAGRARPRQGGHLPTGRAFGDDVGAHVPRAAVHSLTGHLWLAVECSAAHRPHAVRSRKLRVSPLATLLALGVKPFWDEDRCGRLCLSKAIDPPVLEGAEPLRLASWPPAPLSPTFSPSFPKPSATRPREPGVLGLPWMPHTWVFCAVARGPRRVAALVGVARGRPFLLGAASVVG